MIIKKAKVNIISSHSIKHSNPSNIFVHFSLHNFTFPITQTRCLSIYSPLQICIALAGWLSWLEHHPVHQKVTGLGVIPSQGTYLGCGFRPHQGAYRRQLINVSLSWMFFSLSLSLSLPFPSL